MTIEILFIYTVIGFKLLTINHGIIMTKKTLIDYPFLIRVVEQWPIRMKRARLTQKQVAKEAQISEVTLSQLINLHSENPRLYTFQKIEDVLAKYEV